MISPCQEGKSSPEALGRSAYVTLVRVFSSRCCLSAVDSFTIQNQTSICYLSPHGPLHKIECVISCQSGNISK